MPRTIALPDELVARLKALIYPDDAGNPTFTEYVVATLSAAAQDIEELEPIEVETLDDQIGCTIKIVSDPTLPQDEILFVPADGAGSYIVKMCVDGTRLVGFKPDGERIEFDVNQSGKVIQLKPNQ